MPEMPEITRRRLLGAGAAAAGGAMLSSLVPPNLAAAMARQPAKGTLKDIKHVVVLMQENRSFDHYFGTLSGVRGFADPNAITLSTGKSVFYQPVPANFSGYSNPDGYLLPWHLDTKTTSSQAIPSTSHAWAVQHQALDITVGPTTTAAEDLWLQAHLTADGVTNGPFTMSYYERQDIPFHFALAENFTICDGYHCSLLGPTWPNRMFLMTGWNDPNGTAGGPIITNADWLALKIEAVAANPDLWEQTLFILNYDENDGLFDHVPPPLPPAGTPDEFVSTVPVGGSTPVPMPIGGGVRVPCILISPWTVGGYVATENFDHTSVLQLLELITGVEEPNISQWRRDTFGDLTSALGMGGGKAQKAPNLAGPQELSELFWEAEYQVENLPAATPPGALQPFPQQEKHRQPGWMPDIKKNGKRHQGRTALPKTTSRLLENQTNHAGDFEQLKYKDSQFPGILEQRIGKEISAAATHAWVPVVDAGGIAIIDTSTFAFVSALVSETNPYGIASTPDGTKIYVTESGTNLVSSFEVASLVGATAKQAGTTIVVGVYPHGVTVSPDGARAYVANTGPDAGPGGSDTVSAIKVSTDVVVDTFTVGQAPQIIAVSPDSSKLFVTCVQGLYVVDAYSGHKKLATSVCAQAHGVATSPDGNWVFVADTLNNQVLVLDGKGTSVAGQIAVGATPWNVAFTPDSKSAYVTNSGDDTVSVIDIAQGSVSGLVPVSRIPTGIAANGTQMWVTGNVSSTVSVIDTGSNSVISTVALGISAEPISIAFA
jgi:phospholipase C